MSRAFASLLLAACLALTGNFAAMAAESAQSVDPSLKISYALATVEEAREEAPAGLWERIRAGFQLPESVPELTRRHEEWYVKHPAYLERAVERSRLYLYFIAEEVEKRGIPMEIALLPMIESAYNPMALSPMKASGIWQFIPSTGKIFGLQQNAWYDGRRDVVSATRAALDYLQTLYGMFGDWELALAAYNCGEGCVGRAVKNQGKSDYASLRLPAETRQYVPKLIAVRNIIRDPQRFGIQLKEVANEPYFMRVTLARPMEAKQAAKLAEMDMEEFLSLNPAFQRRVIHTESRDVLLLPTERVETFQFNLHRQGLDKSSLKTYEARRGESASNIASRFGVSLDWLKEHNPLHLLRGNKVAQSQTILVPSGKPVQSAAMPAQTTAAKAAPAKRPVMRSHTIRRGDTLARVAKLYRVKVADIRRWNEDAEPLIPGAKLAIPRES